ncbi:hypothetical protein TVAG_160040 [Trichomonas vaginalis G3]|uniref:Uncharacterized protein n=1 Tax=Trichomonas vaginalis (strain ATCC PRA-98 / G3) TaxID=412133 RepID=A2DUU6_TRIV3|nr:hypothetical protein TVAGG3_0259370 [Trichomonas vaginalis G3]EAY15831.1 hypothetical protein TVAG_160040 [Trichomonas vaginalis G3]KAI5525000.1 hypothetical protein TVAGG3_0259370 [Trichomonas vaginalis G3]|eukprot:XP_001328054.1 hypothetical protein [Trichomonas vaginalis G3]
MQGPFSLSISGKRLQKKPAIGSKFYIADFGNSSNSLFIVRNQFTDVLIQSNDYSTISKIYETRFTERIVSASAMPGKKWFLVVLQGFGDGIDPRPFYRAIFINAVSKTAELPVTMKTNTPQYVSWAYSPDNPVFLHLKYDKDKNPIISTYEFNYDPISSSFTINFRRNHEHFMWFNTGMKGATHHTYMVQFDPTTNNLVFSDRTKTDLYPKTCILPSNIELGCNTEFKAFSASVKHMSFQKCGQRMIIHTSSNKLTIILPFSSLKAEITLDYIDLPPKSDPSLFEKFTTTQELEDSCLQYDPLNVSDFPTTKIPFVMCNNGFYIITAPKGMITCFLLDKADRVRASFSTAMPDNCLQMHKMSSLNDQATLCLSQETGEIFNCHLNADFFVKRDPKFSLSLLHAFITPRNHDISIAEFITPRLLKTFWNCEFFSEALLLLFNSDQQNRPFADRVCSTLLDPKRHGDSLFSEYLTQPRGEIAEQYKSFREIFKKIPKSIMEQLPPNLQDFGQIVKTLISLLDTDFFNVETFPVDCQFASRLQITALKHFLDPNAIILTAKTVFPENFSEEVLSTWLMRGMIDEPIVKEWQPGIVSPLILSQENAFDIVNDIWWFMKMKNASLLFKQEDDPLTNLFQHVEQATLRQNEFGPLIFSIHQYLLQPEMDKPIFEI